MERSGIDDNADSGASSAVDGEARAGDVTRLRSRDEGDQRSDVFDAAVPLERGGRELRLGPFVGGWEREVLEKSGSGVFINTLAMLRDAAAAARDVGAVPELEAYDLGHLNMARHLLDEGTLQGPVRIQLVLGVLGGAGNALEDLFMLRERAEKVLGDGLGDLGVAAVGYPMQFRHVAVALSLGMDCRVGMEDSLRLRRDQSATNNAEMVTVATQLAELVGRPIATSTELRARLTRWNT